VSVGSGGGSYMNALSKLSELNRNLPIQNVRPSSPLAASTGLANLFSRAKLPGAPSCYVVDRVEKNIYIAGTYNSVIPLGLTNTSGDSVNKTLRASQGEAVYLIKYDRYGNMLWCASIDGSSGENQAIVAIEASGDHVYLGCNTTSATPPAVYNGDNSVSSVVFAPNPGFCVVKYTKNGEAKMGISSSVNVVPTANPPAPVSINNAYVRITDMIVDTNGDLFLAGVHYSRAPATAYAKVLHNATNRSAFATMGPTANRHCPWWARYNSSGVGQTCVSSITSGNGLDRNGGEGDNGSGTTLALDGSGSIYLAFHGHTGLNVNGAAAIRQPWGYAAHVTKFSRTGTLQWAFSLDSGGHDYATRVGIVEDMKQVVFEGTKAAGVTGKVFSGTVEVASIPATTASAPFKLVLGVDGNLVSAA
jgi:hypothetical protein